MLWRISAQLERRRMTLCKRLTIVTENKKGDTITMRPRIWTVVIENDNTSLQIRLQLNELDQPTYTIQHPDKEVFQTVKTKSGRNIPICDVHSPKKVITGEVERFYTTKALRNRIAGFAGFSFANDVMTQFYLNTPLGDAQ